VTRKPTAEATLRRFESILARFPRVRVGVVGDFLADVYVYGVPTRLSREAPVVILRWEGDRVGPGGAANSAANLLALGARVACVGALGADGPGRTLAGRFRGQGADVSGLLLRRGERTITKTRVLAGDVHRSKQQVIRLDREPAGPPPASVERRTLAAVRRLGPSLDAWLVSDYGYGTVTPAVAAALREGRGGRERIVVVDSRRRLREFGAATALTPNEEEAAEAAGMEIRDAEDAREAGRRLLEATACSVVLVTRGNQGLALFERGRAPLLVPASGGDGDITDNNGAGDTVAATFTLALAAGATPAEAAALANHAGGVVVMKPGAATLDRGELVAQARRDAAGGGRR
jgi:rfaE bifunctional protein kinase chain/domain